MKEASEVERNFGRAALLPCSPPEDLPSPKPVRSGGTLSAFSSGFIAEGETRQSHDSELNPVSCVSGASLCTPQYFRVRRGITEEGGDTHDAWKPHDVRANDGRTGHTHIVIRVKYRDRTSFKVEWSVFLR